MKMLSRSRLSAVCVLAACGSAVAGQAVAAEPAACLTEQSCVIGKIHRTVFSMLPEAHREQIEAMAAVDPDAIEREPMELYGVVANYIDRGDFAQMKPVHQRMLIAMADRVHAGDPVAPLCFTPDTDARTVAAFDTLMNAAANQNRFQQIGRWGPTALNPSGTDTQGDPTILTYSYAPDGTFVPDLIGPSGNSNLFSWLNGIYGSPAVWQPIFDDAFADWGALSGVTYIYEPNDDGSTLNTLPGEPGVRGDLRIAAIFIDGNSGTLAYNNFPQDGDMVFDSGDNFYNTTDNDSQRLYNIIMHEHGHGMGQLHTCPIERAKLMEPFISLRYRGPQSDDILNAQRHYGDDFEPNDSPGVAFDFGTVALESRELPQIASIDGSSDVDWYRFEISEARSITASLDVFGERYVDGPQTSFCDVGSYLDTRVQRDLVLAVTDSSGSVIASSNAGGLGEGESINALLPSAGEYYLRITSGGPNLIQGYNLGFSIDTAIVATPTNPLPAFVQPGVQTPVEFSIDQVGSLDSNGLVLLATANGESPFEVIDLNQLTSGNYCGVLPAFAPGDRPAYALARRVTGDITEQILPRNSFFRPTLGAEQLIFSEDGETDQGWTVSGDASDGQWDRGFAQGNGRGDPFFDVSGNGRAWLTDIDFGTTNSDVDGGSTILTSPLFDMAGGGRIALQLWFTNDNGGAPGQDTGELEISNDNGGNWSLVTQFGPSSPATRWQEIEFDIADFIEPSSQVRIRYTASDLGDGSIVEAGLDDMFVYALQPDAAPDSACAPFDLTSNSTNPGDCGFGLADGSVSTADLTFYVEAWVGAAALADLTTAATNPGDPGFGVPDGTVSVADLTFYVEAWVGCND